MKKIFLLLCLILLNSTAYSATKDVVPRADGEGSIGDSGKAWGNGYFDALNVAGQSVCQEDGTDCPAGSGGAIRYDQIADPNQNSGIIFNALTNVWTATGSSNFFTIDGSGTDFIVQGDGDTQVADLTVGGGDVVLGSTSIFSGGDTASLNNIDAINATTETTLEGALELQDLQGAVIDSQVPNNITVDLATTASALAANGSNCSAGNYPLGVDAAGNVEDCTAVGSVGTTTFTSLPVNKLTDATALTGVNFSTFNSVWTSTTGQNVWTSAVTAGDSFKIVNTGNFDANSSVLKLAQTTGNPTGGAMLFIQNTDAQVNHITAPNFSVTQSGGATFGGTGTFNGTGASSTSGSLTIGGDLTVSTGGSGIVSSSNTAGNILVANGTKFVPVAMSGSCTITSAGAITCSGGGGTADSIAYHKITSPLTNSGIDFSTFNNTWTSTTGTNVWTNTMNGGDSFSIINNTSDVTSDTALLNLKYVDNGDTNALFLKMTDNGSAENKLKVFANGDTMTWDISTFTNLWTSTSSSGAVFSIGSTTGGPLLSVNQNGSTTLGSVSNDSYSSHMKCYTADPCGTLPIMSYFWNCTADEPCVCNRSSVDLRAKDMSTACF